jgi:hypothetical protein
MNPFHTSYPISFRSILILSSHLLLRLPSGLFLLCFPIKIFYTFLISHLCATCPVHITLLHFIILVTFGGEYMHVKIRTVWGRVFNNIRTSLWAGLIFIVCRNLSSHGLKNLKEATKHFSQDIRYSDQDLNRVFTEYILDTELTYFVNYLVPYISYAFVETGCMLHAEQTDKNGEPDSCSALDC